MFILFFIGTFRYNIQDLENFLFDWIFKPWFIIYLNCDVFVLYKK